MEGEGIKSCSKKAEDSIRMVIEADDEDCIAGRPK
jgi:hypothetical protein